MPKILSDAERQSVKRLRKKKTKKRNGFSDKGISISFEKLADKSMVTESEWKSLRRRSGR